MTTTTMSLFELFEPTLTRNLILSSDDALFVAILHFELFLSYKYDRYLQQFFESDDISSVQH